MSSIESKAKTTRQVIDATLGTENWDLKGLGITEVKIDFEKLTWVPLEEAQKLAVELQDVIGLLERVIYTADVRGEKIAEANKILNAPYDGKEFPLSRVRLREALK
jgi:hypothetical protein